MNWRLWKSDRDLDHLLLSCRQSFFQYFVLWDCFGSDALGLCSLACDTRGTGFGLAMVLLVPCVLLTVIVVRVEPSRSCFPCRVHLVECALWLSLEFVELIWLGLAHSREERGSCLLVFVQILLQVESYLLLHHLV